MAPTPHSASHTHTHTQTNKRYEFDVITYTTCLSVFLYVYLQADLGGLTMRATNSERCRPYLATTGLRTSVTGLVGFAFKPTERLIGTKSSLEKEKAELAFSAGLCSSSISGNHGFKTSLHSQFYSLYRFEMFESVMVITAY